MAVAVVTDSTACLPVDVVTPAGLRVVPLRVSVGAQSLVDGAEGTRDLVTAALRERATVSTSRPSPAQFAAVYRDLLDAGASHVVSVHLSAALSGTWESAVLAAQDFPHGTVRVVDSRSAAMALGFAALSAAQCANADGSAAQVQDAATRTADASRTLFYVDTLDHLRRGGRIGAAASLLATTLSVRPLLQLVEGRIVVLEKVRTSAKALTRLVELTTRAAGDAVTDLAVHHVASPQRAHELADRLRVALPAAAHVYVTELGPVLGAHLGPGAVGTVVVPREV